MDWTHMIPLLVPFLWGLGELIEVWRRWMERRRWPLVEIDPPWWTHHSIPERERAAIIDWLAQAHVVPGLGDDVILRRKAPTLAELAERQRLESNWMPRPSWNWGAGPPGPGPGGTYPYPTGLGPMRPRTEPESIEKFIQKQPQPAEGFISSLTIEVPIDGPDTWNATAQGTGPPPINGDLLAHPIPNEIGEP